MARRLLAWRAMLESCTDAEAVLAHSAQSTTSSLAAAGPTAPLYLLVIRQDRVDSHALPRRGQISIGRGDRCDVRIDEPGVSRRHALLRIDRALTIQDLGSANGTRVRGQRLASGEALEISTDDVVQLGSVVVIVHELFSPLRPQAVRSALESQGGGMRALSRVVERVASSNISVLILGETGVGKEVMAETIHRSSARRSGRFLRLNCAALSESLLESELFGHERGAFTGAHQAKMGLLESADGGTVFLDEIGELPMAIQVKLLRVLEERSILPVGGVKSRPIDVRFVAATNRDLEKAIAAGTFRQDLYFRLDGVSLAIPPLRRRVDEIRGLALTFAARSARDLCGRESQPVLDNDALSLLESYSWPGNIRELRNVIERAVLMGGDERIAIDHLPVERLRSSRSPELEKAEEGIPLSARASEGLRRVMLDAERHNITRALDACAGNQTRAAQVLGIARRTLVKKLRQHGIRRPRAS